MGIPCRALFVGYAQNELKNGGTVATAQFLNIGENTSVPLQSIKPTGDDTSDNVYIQTLDFAGRTVASYGWNDWAAEEPCWVDDDYNPVEGVSFAPGTGLWIQGSSAEQGIQTAGKVGASDVVVTLRNGGTVAGNATPVAIDIQDIVALGDEASDNVYIQKLDYAGRTVASYGWNDWAAEEPCWVDDDYNPVEGVTLNPGEGIWVQASSDEQSIQIPAPTL